MEGDDTGSAPAEDIAKDTPLPPVGDSEEMGGDTAIDTVSQAAPSEEPVPEQPAIPEEGPGALATVDLAADARAAPTPDSPAMPTDIGEAEQLDAIVADVGFRDGAAAASTEANEINTESGNPEVSKTEILADATQLENELFEQDLEPQQSILTVNTGQVDKCDVCSVEASPEATGQLNAQAQAMEPPQYAMGGASEAVSVIPSADIPGVQKSAETVVNLS